MAQVPTGGKGRLIGLLAGFEAAIIAGAVATLLVGACGHLAPVTHRPWWLAAATSRGFLVVAAVGLACLAAFVLLAAVMWQLGRPYRPAKGDQNGAVVLEFAMVLPIALMLVLVMAQSGLLMAGHLCVNYSAYCAARAAVVQIPANYSPSESQNELIDPAASGKHTRIRAAAIWPIIPVSCSSNEFPADDASAIQAGLRSILNAYGNQAPGWMQGAYLGRKLGYADQYTDVQLLRYDGQAASGQASYSELNYPYTYGENEEVRVAVYHTFYLSVPYANWFFFKLDSNNGRSLDFGPGQYGLVIQAACSLINEGVQDYVDVESFP